MTDVSKNEGESFDNDAKRTRNKVEFAEAATKANPALKYLGFSFLLAYHYVLWFTPDAFWCTQLLDPSVTSWWLLSLVSTALATMIAAALLGRKKHLSDAKWLLVAIPTALSLATLALEYLPTMLGMPALGSVLAIAAGAIEGLMWILWGESLTRNKAHFTAIHIGATFGCVLIASMVMASLIPGFATPLFVALLCVLSGVLLVSQDRSLDAVSANGYPQLLPRKSTRDMTINFGIVFLIAMATGAACYFLVAIIPWEILPFTQGSFFMGTLIGGGVLLLISALCATSERTTIFKLFPWLLIIVITAYALFLSDEIFDLAGFLMALAVSSVLEVSLIMYFGTLMQRGFFTPAMTFALAVFPIRIGIAAGNSLALFYEAHPVMAQAITPETSLAFMCLLAVLLIPISKREASIIALTSAPASPMQVDVACEQIIAEFQISEREGEILRLLARGNTANAIAEKLVISPHTVNTHIRHIYEKTGIHKRGELIDYINMRRDER